MMSTLKKVKIDFTAYFIMLGSLLCGWFINVILIFVIVFIHELGHVVLLKYYQEEIEEIRIYPFGGITKTKILINTPSNKSIAIALGGVIAQLILLCVFILFFNFSFVEYDTFLMFYKYNMAIIFFNLIPIIPLDGSVILKNILAKFLPYRISNIIYIVISFLGILLFFSYNYFYKINNYMIIGVLIYKSINSIKNYSYERNLFFLERYLYKIKYRKIKYINNKNNFYLDSHHFIKNDNLYKDEDEFLRNMFDNS